MSAMKTTVNVDGLHSLCSFHREAVVKAKRIGCFHCTRFSQSSEIKDWIDMRKPFSGKGPSVGHTAICPKCGIDAVLPDRTYGFRLTKALLEAMRDRWFGPPHAKREPK